MYVDCAYTAQRLRGTQCSNSTKVVADQESRCKAVVGDGLTGVMRVGAAGICTAGGAAEAAAGQLRSAGAAGQPGCAETPGKRQPAPVPPPRHRLPQPPPVYPLPRGACTVFARPRGLKPCVILIPSLPSQLSLSTTGCTKLFTTKWCKRHTVKPS